MKKIFSILQISLFVLPIMAGIPTRYFVGKTEVSECFWNNMPDRLDYVASEFDYDTLIVKSRALPYTHYIDSISKPGEYMLFARPNEVVAEMARIFATRIKTTREQSLSKSVGDSAPNMSLVKYKEESVQHTFFLPGNCYLLSFWATWCGTCLEELKPEYIPSITNQFCDNPSFHFIPVCIDATQEDLEKFFNSELGCKWNYLSDITYLDTDRKANEQYGKSGIMPLNIVIGKDGTIRYIDSGILRDKEELSKLFKAIKSGL